MRYSEELLDQIRARLPVSTVVGQKVALKKAGREQRGLSPFVNEKTPSFFVNDQKGFFHCFASGAHGDIFKFVMATEGLTMEAAVERLAKQAGILLKPSKQPLPTSSSSRSFRVTEKLELIDNIARSLQSRYRFEEIEAFLAEFGLKAVRSPDTNSKWVYAKSALQGTAGEVLLEIAHELDIDAPGVTSSAAVYPPRNWHGTTDFRLFISHISPHKDRATRLKECLSAHAINGFVAHEDIHPTLEWQVEIERALQTMDAFLTIHTSGFSESFWTQQEIGYALGRGVKTISLKMGEDPTGFISKKQALARRGRRAEQIAEEVNGILLDDMLTRERLVNAKHARNPFRKPA